MRRLARHARWLVVILGQIAAGCAVSPVPYLEKVPVEEGDEAAGASSSEEPLIETTRDVVTTAVVGLAERVDELFGSAEVNDPVRVSHGRLSIGGQWDRRDGFEENLRLRAKVALPAMEDRLNLLFGRGTTNEVVDGRSDDNIARLPESFRSYREEDWLLGIGYNGNRTVKNGWDIDAGVKLRTPIETFARTNYYWHQPIGERWMWQLRPRLFWQSQRGFGTSLQQTLDFAAGEDWLLRSWSIAVVDQETEGVAWTTKFTTYNRFSENTAASAAVFASGETDAEVPVLDYGIELRLRRRIFRTWLFVELLTYLSWPRTYLIEERELNPGIGIDFEMQFGNWGQTTVTDGS